MKARPFYLLPLCLLFASNAAAQPVSFAKSDFITGSTPTSVATGDFDQDGDLDLAVARQISNTVSILLGNGDGTFGLQTDFATGPAPRWVVTGDFNADGKLDLATANIGSNTVSILLGNGDGSFGTKTDLIVGGSPFSVVTGDFNLDGKFDLGVTHGGFVSILLGNGNGTFFLGSSLSLGVLATEVTTGDFNWDGKPDLVVGSGTNTVLLLLGNGDGTFGPKIDLPVSASVSVITADFNRDGSLDLATGGGSTISILLGNGDGTFGAATNFPAGSSVHKVTTGDFTGDGKLDLAAANFSGTLTVLVGNGDGTFGPPIDLPALNPLFVATSDFDSDGKLDLALADLLKVSVFTNTTVFAPAGDSFTAVRFLTSGVPLSVTTADFDRDGKLDLATADVLPRTPSETASVLLGNGTGGFGPWTGLAAGETAIATGFSSVIAGDFNRDGRPDLAVSNNDSDTISILLGDGTGGFGPRSVFVVGSNPSSLVSGDFNRDGKLDLAVTHFSPKASILLGNGDGSFSAGDETFHFAGPVAVGDFNRDGKPDLAGAAFGSGVVFIFLGNGDGTFGSGISFDTGLFVNSVTTGDFNQDGKLDLVTSNNDKTANILLGNGDGTFGPRSDIGPLGFSSHSAATGDFNRDGKLDLALANVSTLSILLGNGDGTFAPRIDLPGLSNSTAVVAADFNSDGKLDLAQAGSPRAVPVFLNTPGFNTPAGSNVIIEPPDTTTGESPVLMGFENVTQVGTTSLTTTSSGPAPLSGFKLGTPPTYFDLTTTAVFSGLVTVCIRYSGISFGDESALNLFHFEDGVWVDATVSLNTTSKIICADVSSLSAFAIFEPEANQPPVAHAGPDQTVGCGSPTGTLVTLNGSGSSDPDGDALTFSWTGAFPEGGGTVTGVNPAVTLPLGTHTITLVVNDGQVDSAPDTVTITVTVGLVGLLSPLGGLVPEGDPIPLPDKAFKQGRTLPLKLQLFCGGTLLTDTDVTPPQIVGLVRAGDAPVDLEAVDLDAGDANDNGVLFRFSDDGNWVYNFNTQGLSSGTYTIVIEMPDALRYAAGFVLR